MADTEGCTNSGLLDRALARLDASPGAWAYAIRIWIAMSLALYVAFWLQLDSASSAATCAAILAQPKRGQALSKAFYRFFGTWVGFGASIVFAANFGQDRVLMLLSSGTWLALSVFLANYLQGTRAYGAMLSGYTVSIIAVANIDQPQQVWASGIDRVAAISIGIVAIAFINDALGAPDTYPLVRDQLRKARDATRAFARDALAHGLPAPDTSADLVLQIAAPRADIQAVAGEFSDGVQRVAGARSAVAGLFAAVAATRALSRSLAYAGVDVAEADALRGRVADGLGGDESALSELEARAGGVAADPASTPERVLVHRRAADLLHQDALVTEGISAFEGDGRQVRKVSLPIHRDFPDALRNSLRVALTFGIGAMFFVLTGWPETSLGLLQLSATAALSAVAPNPLAFAKGAAVGMVLAITAVGILKFFVLINGQGFPLYMIATAPVIFLGCFLSLKPRFSATGFILIVFLSVILGPSNPQTYDPQAYLNEAVILMTAVIMLYLGNLLVLPTSDRRKRLWSLQSARADVLEAVRGEPRQASERVNLDSDRLAQFAGRQWRSPVARRAGLRYAFVLAGLDTAAAGAQAALNSLAYAPGFDASVREARVTLARLDAPGLRAAAARFIAATATTSEAWRRPVSLAVADLTAAAHMIDEEGSILRRMRIGDGREPPSRSHAPDAVGPERGDVPTPLDL